MQLKRDGRGLRHVCPGPCFVWFARGGSGRGCAHHPMGCSASAFAQSEVLPGRARPYFWQANATTAAEREFQVAHLCKRQKSAGLPRLVHKDEAQPPRSLCSPLLRRERKNCKVRIMGMGAAAGPLGLFLPNYGFFVYSKTFLGF